MTPWECSHPQQWRERGHLGVGLGWEFQDFGGHNESNPIDGLNGAIVAFMIAGESQLQDANGHGWQWSLFTCLLVAGAMFVPRAIHNRRVARTK